MSKKRAKHKDVQLDLISLSLDSPKKGSSPRAPADGPRERRGDKPESHANGPKERRGDKPESHPFPLEDGTLIRYRVVGPGEVHVSRDDQLLRFPLFETTECRKLIDLAATFSDWDALTDSVDRKSENQHNIFDFAKGTNDGVLYPLCARVSEVVLEPILKRHLGLTDLKLHWAFLRKYTMNGRIEFPCHRDSSAATVNVLLSDPADFTGAELYLLGNEHKNADSLSDKQFKKLLPEAALRQYAVPYTQGECCMHPGKKLHGVLPLTSGSRYTLILMYMP